MIEKKLYHLLIAVLLLGGCTDFITPLARDNPHDPNKISYEPEAPILGKVEAQSGGRAILTWEDYSRVEKGFVIERRYGLGVPWEEVARVEPNVTTYQDQLTKIHAYHYRVAGLYEGANDGALLYSRPRALRLGRLMSFRILSPSDHVYELSWSHEPGLANRLVIEHRASGNPEYAEVASVGREETEYVWEVPQRLWGEYRFIRVSLIYESDTGRKYIDSRATPRTL